MRDPTVLLRTDILIVGGGIAALETLLALHDRLDGARRITVLAPESHFRYRPLAAYAGLVPDLGVTVDLVEMTREHSAGFVHDRLERIHADRAEIQTHHSGRISYEALVVAIGAVTVRPIPGAVTIGYPGDEPAFEALIQRVRDGSVEQLAIVVPPHLRWTLPAYEVALLMRHVSRHAGMKIVVTTPETTALETFGPEIGTTIAALLGERQIELRTETLPDTLAEGHLWMPWQGTFAADAVVALARPAGPSVSGLPVDPLGFIPVDRTGRVVGATGVWAAGDAAAHATKQGGFAMQQADAVAADIARRVDVPSTPAPPLVMRAVLLDGEGALYLRAEQADGHWRGTASREPLWWPPAKVSGGRLADYLAERADAAGGTTMWSSTSAGRSADGRIRGLP